MFIYLSSAPAPDSFGENALLSFEMDRAVIHAKSSLSLTLIQKAARKLRSNHINDVELIGDNWCSETCWAFYQGFYSAKQNYAITLPALDELSQAILYEKIHTSDFVREIINLPAAQITPIELVNRSIDFILNQAKSYASEHAVSYKVLNGEELHQQGYEGIWQVGKGATNQPVLLHLDFNPTANLDTPTLACLVGKGITFDSGGYSIKPSSGMDSMRADMGGAALLVGALGLAIAGGLSQRVQLVLCCAENMVSGHALKLGDIIPFRNNVSVEVLNTDAEGRLVLADGLIDAVKQHPKFIIDCATLTGAAKVAVGNDYHSFLSMDEELTQKLSLAAESSHELFWRLPFAEFHRSQISSAFADISNISSVNPSAGASTATAFLSYFVEKYQHNWLHIDCSATFRKSPNELWATGATGIGVQTLASLLLSYTEEK